MVYYGIFPEGNVISNIVLQDLAKIKGIEYFLQEEPSPHNNVGSRYTLIHPNGEPSFLRINDIELRNIGIQYWANYDKINKAEFTFYDYNLEKTIQVHLITGNTPKFVKQDLLPFMQAYNSHKVSLEPVNDGETKDVKKLEEEIAALKEQLKVLTKTLTN